MRNEQINVYDELELLSSAEVFDSLELDNPTDIAVGIACRTQDSMYELHRVRAQAGIEELRVLRGNMKTVAIFNRDNQERFEELGREITRLIIESAITECGLDSVIEAVASQAVEETSPEDDEDTVQQFSDAVYEARSAGN